MEICSFIKNRSFYIFFYQIFNLLSFISGSEKNTSTIIVCFRENNLRIMSRTFVKKTKVSTKKMSPWNVKLSRLLLKRKEARKGFLTARRMDSKIHASKLPTRKSHNAARESIDMRVENSHGLLEQLKNIGCPPLLLMELLLLEEKRRKLRFQNSQRKAQVALNWPKKDEKGYLKSESKGGWWSQICRSHFVLQ